MTPELVAILDDPASAGLDDMFSWAPVSDLIIHREDLLEANGRTAQLEEDELEITWAGRLETLGIQIALAELPALALRSAAGDRWVAGDGEPGATVTADFDELRRSLQGRRTREVVRAFDWDGDPEPYLSLWTGFTFAWRRRYRRKGRSLPQRRSTRS